MNLRDLRYLVAVAEHRHFGRAAEACFVSQPTLSTQLKKLEETLGVTLIERTNRQVMLTPAGEVIVRQAQVVLREVNTLTALAEQFNDPMGGELRLGIIPTLAPYLLPKIIRPLSEAFPKLHLQLTEAQTATILRMLKQGELDVILLALPLGEENVVEAEIFREPFLFAVGDAHPKAGAKSVSADALDGEQLLLLEDGHCLRDQALALCGKAGARESARASVNTHTRPRASCAGTGI